MKKVFNLFLLTSVMLSAAPIFSQDAPPPRQASRRGDGAGYSTRDATVLSMMGWGIGLAVGIALLCGYIETSSTHAASTSGGGTVH